MHTPSLDQKLNLSESRITKPFYEVNKQKNNLFYFYEQICSQIAI